MQPPIRLMFLGNRRIAWEVLKLLSSDTYRSSFDLRALVTDASIWQEYQALHPQSDACFISSERRQSEQIYETIKTQSIDVLLSIQYNWIIPGNILDLVERRAFNLHNARLPDYKGYHSITHAIINHDTSYETTIHWMTDVVDSGDIAYVTHTPIQADDTAQSLYLRTIQAALLGVQNLLSDLASGADLPRTAMSQGYGNFYSKSSVALLADVTDNVDSKQLALISRATFFPPNNTAHFYYEGKKYLIVPENEAKKIIATGKPINEPLF